MAFDYEKIFADVRCAAAPIFDYTGGLVATLGCAVPTVHITEDFSARLPREVRAQPRKFHSCWAGRRGNSRPCRAHAARGPVTTSLAKENEMPRIVVGVSGASGMPLARTVLKNMALVPDMEIHLVVSAGARRVLQTECDFSLPDLTCHAHAAYEAEDMAAGPSSGSWRHDGMVICPCSMSSLASIASGAGMNLLHRSADVTLKERLPLIIVARETPLNLIHLKNMQAAAEAGATIMPFCPAFYTRETDLNALARHFTGRILDQLGISHSLCARWCDNL